MNTEFEDQDQGQDRDRRTGDDPNGTERTGAEETAADVAEKPGSGAVSHEHADELADEWSEDSFPASDPPAHY